MSNWLLLALAVGLWFLLVLVLEAHKIRHDEDE